jgi:DNA polymerase-4
LKHIQLKEQEVHSDETYRKIIHVDMDAFFASIEQRDFPELKGKPVAVGSANRRGVIAAASYEAREFGVRSAMPSSKAIQLCPQLIFVDHRFSVYHEVSKKIREIFHRYTDLVEPLSLDEAYLDVTHNKPGISLATEIAREIREKIFLETQLTASAGISFNKFLAKMASDINKPNGQKLIHPSQADEYLKNLAIGKFFGVGKVTADKMKKAGIEKGEDLKKYSKEALIHLFGKQGEYYYHLIRGIDNRKVVSERERKSVGAERTFRDDVSTDSAMNTILTKIAIEVAERLKKGNHKGRTITLKFKYFDFEQHTRSRTIEHATDDAQIIITTVMDLLMNDFPEKPVRLLGITLSKLGEDIQEEEELSQLTLGF